jgi:hypothetical protein
MVSRREFFYGLGASIGAAAFSSLLADEAGATGPLSPKAAMLPAKAKACIWLTMEGGPSHIDTFDPKPKLADLHLSRFVREGDTFSAMSSGERYYVQSPFGSVKAGAAGADMCDRFIHLRDVADDICFYRGCQGESVNHPTAMFHMNTGSRFGGDPAVGAWVTYGLGTLSENLPAFVVLPEVAYPQGGPPNWGNGFLPAHYQGTPLRSKGAPILDMEPPGGLDVDHRRRSLDLLNEFNTSHAARHPNHDALAARMESYELAFRMQMEAPDAVDLGAEDEATRELYGIGAKATDAFGRKCLTARRLVERGVRFVQLYSGGWDSHDYLERAHGSLIESIDRPITALIKDLKRRGMLDETLIVWCGEFGRSPDNGIRGGGVAYGRDHNPGAMAMWFAGGGVNAGHVIGATDEIGETAVEVAHPIKDAHVTILRLLGLDDNKLTYFHGGRYKQLSQTGGQVIPELIA